MIKVKKQTYSKALLAMAVLTLTTGCMSLENEEGRLPDALRSAISGFAAKGYPDLTKLPEAPTDLPTSANWGALESRLVSQGRALANNPAAVAPTPDETNLGWAQSQRQALESDPRAQLLPPLGAGEVGSVEWAKAARAKMEADLARLPPP